MKHMRIACLMLGLITAASCARTTSGPIPAADIMVSSPEPYVLGAGDKLSISVWRHNELATETTIDPAGNIDIPLVGSMRAADVSPSDLRSLVAKRLSKYVVDPQVSINIVSTGSRRVHVLGEVRTPGSYNLTQNTYLWEIISQAGGFTRDANKKHVLHVRKDKSSARVTAVDWTDLLKGADMAQSKPLWSGDVVYVPPKRIANVERFMSRLNTILTPIVTLERAIIFAPEVENALKSEDESRVLTTISP